MNSLLGIRREDKNRWERRVPITPEHIKKFKDEVGIQTCIQPSKIRSFSDEEYIKAGAIVKEDISECPVVFAVKEIPIDFFKPKHTYVFFSHTIKGQKYNMPMLRKMMDLECNLIDYERIADSKGRRLVFFGRYAGLAGMLDSLWSLGTRLHSKNIDSYINEIKQTINYENLQDAKKHLKYIGEKIEKNGLPESITPLVIGFAGYGNVSKGCQEILDILPVKEVNPEKLSLLKDNFSKNCVYKVIFKEEDLVKPISEKDKFELKDYYYHPEKYQSRFHEYIPYLTILMNCIYWDERYPRLITKEYVKKHYTDQMKLQVIGDISIDINGAIEFTEKATNPDAPSFVYNPILDKIEDGVEGKGIVVMGVDNLPCELPRESSEEFSKSLVNVVPNIVKADFNKDFNDCKLPDEIKKAVILYHGKLTKDYSYIDNYI